MTNTLDAGAKVLVFGVTGKFGGRLAAELKKRGAVVRGLVRRAEQADQVRSLGLDEIAIGDLNDRDSLCAALNGVDRLFYVPPPFFPDEAEVGKWVVDASKRAGLRRIVFLSAIHPNLSEFANHAAKATVEEAILNSGLEFTLLQPAMTFQNIERRWPGVVKTGVFAEPWSTETRFSRVDARDVAEVGAIALTEDRLLHGTFELCSDSCLNRYEVASMMSVALGREIKPERSDPTLLGHAFDAFRPLFAHYDHHDLLGNSLILRAILTHEPRTFESFLNELAGKPQVS